ncbi:pyrroline-5-carboxylate reductase [Legionella wadsworthii]|uniref:Pyrroline-5-carboxylate reductase n=1 Tax=Legionella wadsworthii TaxID=28088 RepID=A0A378LSB2_9GAMM|nr:pyrroline-5-carboxylate reductase [Legionella wadsworthii]STY28748.1 pyrroline-5-carboxylate reductase [Legionella wadsworthii]
MSKFNSITVIGAGNLGSAFIRGLIRSGYPENLIKVSSRDSSKPALLVRELNILSAQNNAQAAEDADIIVLAVKPQFMQSVCRDISQTIRKKLPVIISLAGIINISNMTQWLGVNHIGVVRSMSNTPIEFCKGTSALFANSSISHEQKLLVQDLFQTLGLAFWVDEETMLDTLTAPIGCAPAYAFLFLEALQGAAISRGIPEELAAKVALESVLGAAELAKKSERSFAQLRQGVTTPNGVTEYSLKKLSLPGLFDSFKEVFAAVEERIDQITETLKNNN